MVWLGYDQSGSVEMIEGPQLMIDGFIDAAVKGGFDLDGCMIEHEVLVAPHRPKSLPCGKCAIYVFSLSAQHGEGCPAGANRTLKVGKVGPRSNARFQSQHYLPNSSRSNLALSLLNLPILWTYLGIRELSVPEVGRWLQENTDRDHFFIPGDRRDLLDQLEVYVQGLLGPVFEGSLGKGSRGSL